MKRLLSVIFILLLSLPIMTVNAQKKAKLTFETIYRPVYGYLIDSLTNIPFQNVSVYAFDSIDDARLGEDALRKSRNPMKIKLKGDVVETRTDESGRYMVPARSTGALVFHLKERQEIIVEEIAGRSEISRGRRVEKAVPEYDISELLGKDYRREPGKVRRRGPEGVVLDMDFKAYIPQPGDKAKVEDIVRSTSEALCIEVKTRKECIGESLCCTSVVAGSVTVVYDSHVRGIAFKYRNKV